MSENRGFLVSVWHSDQFQNEQEAVFQNASIQTEDGSLLILDESDPTAEEANIRAVFAPGFWRMARAVGYPE